MKERKRVIILFCLFGVALLAYFAYNSDEKHYQWFESYRAADAAPYGVMFIEKMLATGRPPDRFTFNEKQPLRKLLKNVGDPAETDYILIGHDIFLDGESLNALVHFIDAGGNAFISTLTPPARLINAIYSRECNTDIEYQSNFASHADLNFFHESLRRKQSYRYAFRFGTTDAPYPWRYVSNGVFCDSTAAVVPLGYLDEDRVNFIGIRVGKGNLFLHTSPLVFTNYFLTDAEKVDYAESVFSELDGSDLIWDEYSKIPSAGGAGFKGPLYFILQQPALKYAWWMLLATVALYVVFAAKRRQRVIPVLEVKSNTSLEFVNLISRLHYENGNHVDMARKKMKYFLYFVRSKYGIHAEGFQEDQIRRLAEKSRVSIDEVRAIFSQYALIDERFRDYIEANRLVDLYEAIENFYRQCK
jgi:hypothetical protein